MMQASDPIINVSENNLPMALGHSSQEPRPTPLRLGDVPRKQQGVDFWDDMGEAHPFPGATG